MVTTMSCSPKFAHYRALKMSAIRNSDVNDQDAMCIEKLYVLYVGSLNDFQRLEFSGHSFLQKFMRPSKFSDSLSMTVFIKLVHWAGLATM